MELIEEINTALSLNKNFNLITPEIDNTILYGIEEIEKVYRYDKAEDRYYFKRHKDAPPTPYLSITSWVNHSLPTNKHLEEWKENVGGLDAAKYIANYKANYGTTMHMICTDILKTGRYSFDEVKQTAFQEAIHRGYRHKAIEWVEDMTNDIASFLIFAKERISEIVACEIVLTSDKYKLGGALDFVGRVKFNGSNVNAIVDFKSGKKGFFDVHELQLHGYKKMWNDRYGHVFPITHVFNFAPQNPKAKTPYKFENQTDSKFSKTIDARLSFAIDEEMIKAPTTHITFRGGGNLIDFDLQKHLIYTDII